VLLGWFLRVSVSGVLFWRTSFDGDWENCKLCSGEENWANQRRRIG